MNSKKEFTYLDMNRILYNRYDELRIQYNGNKTKAIETLDIEYKTQYIEDIIERKNRYEFDF